MNNDDEIDPAAVVRFLKATGFSNLAAAFESFERMTAPQRRRRSRRQCTTLSGIRAIEIQGAARHPPGGLHLCGVNALPQA
jgi:hypothetical protein